MRRAKLSAAGLGRLEHVQLKVQKAMIPSRETNALLII